jgi:hypothetical protein
MKSLAVGGATALASREPLPDAVDGMMNVTAAAMPSATHRARVDEWKITISSVLPGS